VNPHAALAIAVSITALALVLATVLLPLQEQPPFGRLLKSGLSGGVLVLASAGIATLLGFIPFGAATAGYLLGHFVHVAVAEEAPKALVAAGFIGNRDRRIAPAAYDAAQGAVLGAAVGAGFGIVESALLSPGGSAVLLRTFTAIPLHAGCTAIISGAIAGRIREWHIGRSLVLAVVLHAGYNISVEQDGALQLLGPVIAVVSVVLAVALTLIIRYRHG